MNAILRCRVCLTVIVCIGLVGGVLVAVVPSGAATLLWRVTETPHPSSSIPSELFGVACPTGAGCFAVGDAHYETLVEYWDGTSWTRMASPNPGPEGSGFLYQVSCPSSMSCFAVGQYSFPYRPNHPGEKTLVEHWDGTNWTVMPSPNRQDEQFSALNGVSCPSSTRCFALGSDLRTAFIEQWDGIRWSNVAMPTASANDELGAVSCPTTTSCFAVGDSSPQPGEVQRALVEHWNGSRWTVMTGTPSPSNFDELNGVACPRPNNCFAVGSEQFTQRALVEHWNGHGTWTVMNGTPSPSDHTVLVGVSCPTTKNCFADGIWSSGSNPQTRPQKALVEHWTGHGAWVVMRGPELSNSWLFGLSCPSATSCVAVGKAGGTGAASETQQSLIEQYG
jgi:hypothetical protein